jgi:hypothetical protein
MDYMGPFNVSVNGKKYALAGIDELADYGWVECTKQKDEAYDEVGKILKDARAKTGYAGTIIVITDNEPLFKSESFRLALEENNAVRMGSIEYEHRSNGKIERHNQRLQQVARCAFAQSGLTPELWPLVMKYAQAILNRIVQKDGSAPVEKFSGGKVRGADLGIFGALVYYLLPKEQREKEKLAMRAGLGVYVGPAEAYGKTNGVAILTQNKHGKFKTVFAASVKFDNKVFPFRHGLQETLTSRQYKPIIDALKGAEQLDLEYEADKGDAEYDGTKFDLLGRSVCMLAKGRTRFGKREWFGKITGIIRDDKEPHNESKMQCRIFFQPSDEHPEGAYQNVPMSDARGMVVSEEAALIMDCMPQTLLLAQLYTTLGVACKKRKKKKSKGANGVFTSFKQIDQQEDAEMFKQAYAKEKDNFEQHGVYTHGTPSPDDLVTRLIPLMQRKSSELKGVSHKVRFVLDGFQLPSDGVVSYAPVARMEAVITMLSLLVGLGMDIAQVDVSSAYLHADAPRTVYARPLPGMEDPTGTHKYIKILKAVYGEHAAGRAFFGFHIDVHTQYGFEKVARDGTILMYRTTVMKQGEEVESVLLLVTIVDDSILGYEHREVADKYFEYLQSKEKIVVSYTPKVFVGLEIDYDREQRVMKLGQADYLHKVAQKYGINKEDPTVASPWKPGVELQLAEGEADPELVTMARSIIGAIAWASNATRKDVLAPIKTASRVMHRPTPVLIDYLMHLMQWLFNTRLRQLTFRGDEEWETLDGTKIARNQLAVFVDSSYANAGPQFQMKSQYGYCILLNGACVAAGSGLGPHPVDSSSYAEVVALHVASKDILYLQQILDAVCCKNKPKRPIVFEDNTTAIAVMTNNKSATRSRHFAIKYFYLADFFQRGDMVLQYVTSEDQVADILTKATPPAIFNRLSKRLMGES